MYAYMRVCDADLYVYLKVFFHSVGAWRWLAASISSFAASLIVKEPGKNHTVLSHIRPADEARRRFTHAQSSSSLSLPLSIPLIYARARRQIEKHASNAAAMQKCGK